MIGHVCAEIAANCKLEAQYFTVRESISHEFGTTTNEFIDLEDMQVLHYVNGEEFDVTESVKKNSPETFEMYRKILINKAKQDLAA